MDACNTTFYKNKNCGFVFRTSGELVIESAGTFRGGLAAELARSASADGQVGWSKVQRRAHIFDWSA